jgi:LCP family protein required for cell wall assembly
MSSNWYDPDEPTRQVPPYTPPQQGPQGKLILGGSGNASGPQSVSNNTQRRPYQNPVQQPQQPTFNAGQQANIPYAQRPVSPNQNAPQYQQPSALPQSSYPRNDAAPAGPSVLQRPKPKRNRRVGCGFGCLSLILILIVAGAFFFNVMQHVLAFGTAISTQTPLSTRSAYMNTSDRTNLLVMGFGGGTHDGAYLTDSMLVVSLLPQSHHTSLVSVPRDLFIQYPPSSGQYTKINAVYEFASNNNKNASTGGDAAAQKVALVTGMNIKYWLTIDFSGFRKVIDSIGGVDVYVPDSFNACYPKNDDAAVDASWIKVQFNKGMQHMDGNTAIEYARAREPLAVCGMGQSQNLSELTDFGRSARQQIIVKAVLSKIKQMSTWPKIYDAMNALQKAMYTNMSLADLSQFALKMDLNDPKAAHIGLSNQNVLADGQSNDGQYILQPQNGDWSLIPKYIQQHLYN